MTRQHEVEEGGRRTVGEDARERLLSGLPVTEQKLQLAGVSTAVLEGGDGPPIVLLLGEFAAVWMRVRAEMGERYEWIAAYALDRFRTPAVKAAMRSLGRQLASAIPSGDLDRIAVPTTLIWGRHDLGVRLNVAEAASVRHGWPLHVIEDARDDPAIEQPQAFLEALRTALDSAPLRRPRLIRVECSRPEGLAPSLGKGIGAGGVLDACKRFLRQREVCHVASGP